MSLMLRKTLSLILCICMIATFTALPVNAKTGKVTFDGQEYEIVVNNQDIITMKQIYQGHEITASLDKKTNEITAEVVEKPNNLMRIGKSKKHKYKIEVQKMDESGITAVAKDLNTYQVIDLDKNATISHGEHKHYGHANHEHINKVIAQAPIVLIPLGTVLGALLAALLAAAATVIIAGVTYTLVSDLATELKKNKDYDYYTAIIYDDDVWIGSALESRQHALQHLRNSSQNNVFTKNNSLADSLSRSVAGSNEYCTMNHNKNGYYAHWHPKAGGVKLNNHVWFFG